MIKSTERRIRNEIADLSTGSNYYRFKGDAIQAIDRVLEKYGYTTDYCNMPGDDGRVLIPILFKDENLTREPQGNLVFNYHRMEVSGNYEIVVYIS